MLDYRNLILLVIFTEVSCQAWKAQKNVPCLVSSPVSPLVSMVTSPESERGTRQLGDRCVWSWFWPVTMSMCICQTGGGEHSVYLYSCLQHFLCAFAPPKKNESMTKKRAKWRGTIISVNIEENKENKATGVCCFVLWGKRSRNKKGAVNVGLLTHLLVQYSAECGHEKDWVYLLFHGLLYSFLQQIWIFFKCLLGFVPSVEGWKGNNSS